MKIDSYKVIKYIFYIFCIISLFFSIKSKVYADSYTFISNYSNSSRTMTFPSLQPGAYSSKTIDFNTNLLDLTNYSNMTGKITVANTTKYINYTLTDSINWGTTCTHYNSIDVSSCTTTGCYYTITYADGNTARISSNGFGIGQYLAYFCDQWSSTGTISSAGIQYNFDNKPTIHVILVGEDYNAYQCIVDTNGNFTCPGGRKYRQMQVGIVSSGVTSDYIIIITNNIIFKISDTQTIINNNNQNTTTINNSIQDTNNTLKDDNVSGNNSNDTISSIGNTFDTENDFLLGLLTIPYNFFNSLVNIFDNNCTSLNLGSMFGEDLVFPCLSLSNLLGNVFTNVIDVIFCGVIMSAFLRRIVKYYQALLSLDERATQIGGVKIW